MDTVPRKTRTMLGLAIALPVVGVVAFLVVRGQGADPAGPDGERGRRAHLADIPESAPSGPPAPAPPSADEVDKRVEAALADWRRAIVNRDAEAVMKLDTVFLDAPATYLEALKNSAASDDNERVRAFSTRELGKLKRVDLAPTFMGLLEDKSPFVRQNAAWALGELGAENAGRTAARQAIAELRQVVKHDPAGEVRAAARTTLDRLE
jgi:HEAT repeat protein